jgi:hypothetical protein
VTDVEALRRLASNAFPITPGNVVGLFESQAMQQYITTHPKFQLRELDHIAKGADAIRVEYLHPYLRQGLEMYGYDPVAYCERLRESLRTES